MGPFIRTRILPWVVWLSAMGGAAWLWQDTHNGAARGFVEDTVYSVAAPQPGRIDAVLVSPGQHVAAGQVIATLDARELTVELEILAAERGRIEAELGAVASETQVRLGATSRGIEESVAAAERALQTARADRGVITAELAAMTSQVDALKALVDKHMADRRELDALTVKHAALKKELQGTDAQIAQLISQAAGARARRGDVPADATDRATDPLRAELAVLRQQEQLLTLRKDALTLRAPVDGEITTLHLRAGEIAPAGAPIASLSPHAAAATASVFVCLDEPQAIPIRAGEAVTLHAAAGITLPAHVARLSPDVAQLPPRCWRDSRTPEWGRAAHVALDEPAPLLPGQSFTVAFLGKMSPHAGDLTQPPPVTAAIDQAPAPSPARVTAAAPVTPTAMTVPPVLLARTRFEPSALTWSPRLDRFVIASDDTGLPDRDEHAPWLFTMDVRGRVDPEPLIIAGVDDFSDLESIAPAPDGGLYVLASQSRSRKGKRSPARQRFVHVALTETGARAVAIVQLAALLDDAGPDALADLGLGSTAELDIEGMTATAEGGLLLGLKAPLGPRGEALIWHLKRPDALLSTGDLARGELTTWGSIALTVEADGAPTPGGISELLELDDRSLLIATTASGTDPNHQSGALYHVTGRTELARPRHVRVFAGLKPEGLARAGQAVVIVFDTGAAAPQWMEQPWPDR